LIWTRRELLPALLLLLGPLTLGAQEGDSEPPPGPGESLKVSLITVGQGDVVWERFGHNAILIQDEETGWQAFYHWGVFDFEQADFIPRLIRGTMLYSMGVSDPVSAQEENERAGRPAWVQELALTPSQRWELRSLVQENALPENREYRYDYYLDNCSTRVRDYLDRILDGRLGALYSADTTAFTYRWHTRRLLRDMPLYYLGIQFVLGPTADRPITEWEEMFLPLSLMNGIREVQVPDGSGGVHSVVASERVLLDPGRPEPPTSPPPALPIFLVIGILWGGGLLWLVGAGSDLGVGRRLGVALLGGGWGLLAALSGSLLLGAWLFTDHIFWYANFNLFQVNPLFLPLPVVFLMFLFQDRFPRWGRDLAMVLGVASIAGLALELIPGLGQKNGEILALTLPVNIALWMGAVRLHRSVGEKASAKAEGAGCCGADGPRVPFGPPPACPFRGTCFGPFSYPGTTSLQRPPACFSFPRPPLPRPGLPSTRSSRPVACDTARPSLRGGLLGFRTTLGPIGGGAFLPLGLRRVRPPLGASWISLRSPRLGRPLPP